MPSLVSVVRFQRIVMALLFALLFIAVVTAPQYGALWGVLGGRGVWLSSLALMAVSASYCWARNTRLHPDYRTNDEAADARRARWTRFVLLCLFLGFVNLFAQIMTDPHGPGLVVGHDAPQYYAYLHSWCFDRDLAFENEYAQIPGIASLMAREHPGVPGYNVAPIGTAVLWLPFYVVAHGVLLALKLLGLEVTPDGIFGALCGCRSLREYRVGLVGCRARARHVTPVVFRAHRLLCGRVAVAHNAVGVVYARRSVDVTRVLLLCGFPRAVSLGSPRGGAAIATVGPSWRGDWTRDVGAAQPRGTSRVAICSSGVGGACHQEALLCSERACHVPGVCAAGVFRRSS